MVFFSKTHGQASQEKPAKEHGSLRRISSLIFNEERRPPSSSSNYEDRRGRTLPINPTPPLDSHKASGFSSWQTTRASSIESRYSSRPPSIFSIDTPHGLAQTLLKQGRKLKRQASKLSLTSLNNDKDDTSSVRDTASPCLTRRNSVELGRNSPSISAPTNFQHLTHAKAQQFSNLGVARDNDLIADFSALRASQASRTDLRGIRADDIQSRGSSLDLSTEPSLGSASSRDSLVSSGLSTPGSRMSVRSTRSKESFSQPFPKLRRNRLGPPPVAPPRSSSKWAFTAGHKRNTSSESSLGEGRCSDDGWSSCTSEQDLPHSPIANRFPEEMYEHGQDYHALSTDSQLMYEHDLWYGYENVLPCVQEEEALMEFGNDLVYYHPIDDSAKQFPDTRCSSASGISDLTIVPMDRTPRDSAVEISPISAPAKEKIDRRTPSRASKNEKPAPSMGLFSSWRDDESEESDVDPFIKAGANHGSRKTNQGNRAVNQASSTNSQQRKPWRSPGVSTAPTGKGYTPKLNKQLPPLPVANPPKSPSSRPQTPKSLKSSKSKEEVAPAKAPETPPKQVNGVSASVEGTTLKLSPGFFAKGASSATHSMVQLNLKHLHDTLAQLESQMPLGYEPTESPQKPSRIPVSSNLKTALRRPTTPSRRKNVAFAADTITSIPKATRIPTMTALPQRAY